MTQIAKVKLYLPFNDFERVTHTLITSRLHCCSSWYYELDMSSLRRLQMVLNVAARLLMGKKKYDHINPVLASLHWVLVTFRIQFKILLLAFKSLNGLAPSYLLELLCAHVPVRTLRSTDQFLVDHPTSRLRTRGDRAFAVAAAYLWNALPFVIRSAQSLESFKSLLKTHLFALDFNQS